VTFDVMQERLHNDDLPPCNLHYTSIKDSLANLKRIAHATQLLDFKEHFSNLSQQLIGQAKVKMQRTLHYVFFFYLKKSFIELPGRTDELVLVVIKASP
jgi:hypothetical protein